MPIPTLLLIVAAILLAFAFLFEIVPSRVPAKPFETAGIFFVLSFLVP